MTEIVLITGVFLGGVLIGIYVYFDSKWKKEHYRTKAIEELRSWGAPRDIPEDYIANKAEQLEAWDKRNGFNWND